MSAFLHSLALQRAYEGCQSYMSLSGRIFAFSTFECFRIVAPWLRARRGVRRRRSAEPQLASPPAATAQIIASFPGLSRVVRWHPPAAAAVSGRLVPLTSSYSSIAVERAHDVRA